MWKPGSNPEFTELACTSCFLPLSTCVCQDLREMIFSMKNQQQDYIQTLLDTFNISALQLEELSEKLVEGFNKHIETSIQQLINQVHDAENKKKESTS